MPVSLPFPLSAPLVAPVAGGRAPSLVIRPVAAVLPPPVGAPASLPPLQGPVPLAPPVTVVPVPAVVEVLQPLWGPPLTGRLGERVRREVPEVRATAATCTGREGTGAVLEATEVGRWETVVRVPGRVLVIDLLRDDGRRRRMRQRRRRHHEGEGALARRRSRDWGVIGTGQRRRHGRETRGHGEGGPHLVVGERGPDWAGGKGALR